MIMMITSDGNTTPSVAKMPPQTPACFCPTNVAVLTAMTPGVHWPMAYQSMTSSSVAQRRFFHDLALQRGQHGIAAAERRHADDGERAEEAEELL